MCCVVVTSRPFVATNGNFTPQGYPKTRYDNDLFFLRQVVIFRSISG